MVEGHQQGLSDVKPFPFLVGVSAAQPEDLMVLLEAAEGPEWVVLAVVVSPQLRDTDQMVVMHPHQTILHLPEEY